MDMSDKIRALKEEVQGIGAEEKAARSRIAEMKALIAEKQKRLEALELLKKEEQELLELLQKMH